MDQLASKKGKKCKSGICSVCENFNGLGDFVDCEKCGLSIHKICFKLRGELLKIFQDFEKRNEKFPFTVLCPGCRQFNDKNINNVQVLDSCEENDNSKNPLEIDCVVSVLVDHLNVQDLVNVRLVNKLWNENACRLLSKVSRQDQLKAYDAAGENVQDLENCLQIVKRSDQKKLMQKWTFPLDIPEEFKVCNQILTIAKPTSVILSKYNKLKLDENTLFSTILTNISENVVDLSLEFEEITGFEQTQFCMPKFFNLKSIRIINISHDNYEFIKIVIENCPKLMNLTLSCDRPRIRHDYDGNGDDLTLDNYITEDSQYCILTEKSAQNLQKLKMLGTCFNFDTFFHQMKLKTLSLHADYVQDLKFGKLKSFLTSQNDTLETLKIVFPIYELVPLDEIEDLETGQLTLPRLENLQHFSLEFEIDTDAECNTDEEIWLVKPINLAGKFPHLKKISITYCQNWALSFESGQKSSTVTELVLKKWKARDLAKLVGLFPRVEILNLKKLCFNPKIVYIKLDNLNGWSESLKRIEINCDYYHLENFDFEKLTCLTNLKSIKISNRVSDGISVHFIYPDFRPLYKITTLSQVAIKNFKISKGIVEDLREKYPSLDYSFYPKCC